MGLAASQGRYLCLTARMNDLIFEGQQISQQRLNLAKETQQVADAYNDKINNKILVANMYLGGEQPNSQVRLTYDVLTKSQVDGGLGYRIVDCYGNVVIPDANNFLEISEENENGQEYSAKYYSASDFMDKYMSDLPDSEKSKINSLQDVQSYYEAHYKSQNRGKEVKLVESYPAQITKDNPGICYDENIRDANYLQQMLESGEYLLQKPSEEDLGSNKWDDFDWKNSSNLTEVYDTSDDAAAEAEYEAAVRDIERRDKILELRLTQVQTEENAVEKELDSIKTVIDKNIEGSFKTFSA